jgi:hypothetical protein
VRFLEIIVICGSYDDVKSTIEFKFQEVSPSQMKRYVCSGFRNWRCGNAVHSFRALAFDAFGAHCRRVWFGVDFHRLGKVGDRSGKWLSHWIEDLGCRRGIEEGAEGKVILIGQNSLAPHELARLIPAGSPALQTRPITCFRDSPVETSTIRFTSCDGIGMFSTFSHRYS